jgi:hypothetical protein
MLAPFERRYGLCALAILTLAAWNVGYRLDRDIVAAWDESLYGTTAAEMLAGGDWVVTTFRGQVDYYNAKPPLNVWLIALSFWAFGINLVSLRLVSALSALLTIVVVQRAGAPSAPPRRWRPVWCSAQCSRSSSCTPAAAGTPTRCLLSSSPSPRSRCGVARNVPSPWPGLGRSWRCRSC